MKINLYLNPNPPLNGDVLIDRWGRKYFMKNEPFLEVEFINFPKGEYEVEFLYPFANLKKIEIKSSRESIYFLDKRFGDPSISQIKLKLKGKNIEKEFDIGVKVYKITGKIKRFNKRIFPVYLWAAREKLMKYEIIAKVKENDTFTIYYPEGRKLRLFIADTTYGKSSLETWIYADELKGDIKVNPFVGGNFEFYEIKVWYHDEMWNVFFIPAIVDSIYPPDLNKEDIKLWINDFSVKIKSFTPHRIYFYSHEKNKGKYYPAYLLTGRIEKLKDELEYPIIIRLFISSNKKNLKGEGWYICF